MDEITPGTYVYFNGSAGRKFRVIRVLPKGRLEILLRNTPYGQETRIVTIVKDEVTTASNGHTGEFFPRGFFPEVRVPARWR